MNGLGEFLKVIGQLGLKVGEQTPEEIAHLLVDLPRDQYDPAFVAMLDEVIVESISEWHGPQGLIDFQAAYQHAVYG